MQLGKLNLFKYIRMIAAKHIKRLRHPAKPQRCRLMQPCQKTRRILRDGHTAPDILVDEQRSNAENDNKLRITLRTTRHAI